jgi:hypothetical protein
VILAEFNSYIHWWWYPLVLLALPAAFFLGGQVLHKSLAKHVAEGAHRKFTVGRCCVAVFLAVASAGMCGGAVYYMMSAIGSDNALAWWIPIIVGAVAAIPAFVLTIVAMFNMPFGQLLPGTVKALGVVVVISGICGTAIGVPANFERVGHIQRNDSADHLHKIFGYLQEASTRFTKAMPPDLASLKKIDKFDAQLLKCPRRPDLEVGFFYYSPGSEAMLKANPLTARGSLTSEGGEGIIACEFKGSATGVRVFLMRNGNVQWLPEDEFQETLNKKINEDFRKELAKADK